MRSCVSFRVRDDPGAENQTPESVSFHVRLEIRSVIAADWGIGMRQIRNTDFDFMDLAIERVMVRLSCILLLAKQSPLFFELLAFFGSRCFAYRFARFVRLRFNSWASCSLARRCCSSTTSRSISAWAPRRWQFSLMAAGLSRIVLRSSILCEGNLE